MKNSKQYIKKILVTLLVLITLVATGCQKQVVHVTRDDWAADVKVAINDFLDSNANKENNYVVFDFDNTVSIFDIEDQLGIYQLEHMAFAISPENLADVLLTELSNPDEDLTDLGYGKGSYNDWVRDIVNAYKDLYARYEITPKGLDEETALKIQEEPMWQEFATKMRAMYDLVYDNESPSVAYPWITYWFTGMTTKEVYDLALASHKYYASKETSKDEWKSPETIISFAGPITCEFTRGVQVSENLKELMKALSENGIDIWICSASAQDVVRAAIDFWGLHDYVTGLIGMISKIEDDVYVNEYDYENGCAWLSKSDESWEKDDVPQKAQPQGVGKVTAIENVICKKYGHGPLAGFMDSTGDFNFCTEFETLELVVCFNRANRKVTDGGGLIAELAMYQKDYLGYDFAKARKNKDTFYVLQGRDENGLRSLRASNKTLRLGESKEKLLCNEDNETELAYFIEHKLSTEEIVNTFCIATSADDSKNLLGGMKYGFLDKYNGYHSHK